LSNGKRILGHRVTGSEMVAFDPQARKTLKEELVTVMADGFGTIDEGSHILEPKPVQISLADASDTMIVGEIRQPTERAIVSSHGLEQDGRAADPMKW
jgi:hypothetical protein